MKSVADIQKIIKDKIPEGRIVAEHTDVSHFYRDTSVDELYASVTAKTGIIDAPHLKKWAAKLAVEYVIDKVSISPEILKPGAIIPFVEELKPAAILAHKDLFEEAGDIGTKGHKVIEDYLDNWMKVGQRPTTITSFIDGVADTRMHAIARSAEAFFKDFHVEPIASELRVASNRHKFAGTLDALMMVGRVTDKGNGAMCDHSLMLCFSKSKQIYACANCGLTIVKEFCLVDFKTSNSINKVDYALQTSAYWQALQEMTGLRPKHILIVRFDKYQAKYEVMRVLNRPFAFRAYAHLSKIHSWLTDGVDKLEKYPPKIKKKLSDLN